MDADEPSTELLLVVKSDSKRQSSSQDLHNKIRLIMT